MTMVEKTGFYLSLLVFVILLFFIFFSRNGVFDYKTLNGKERIVLKQIQTIDQQNHTIETEIQRLKTDMDYIKHVAKHEHDMAEEGELIFKDKSGNKRNMP